MITFYLPAAPLGPRTSVVLLLVLNCLDSTGILTSMKTNRTITI